MRLPGECIGCRAPVLWNGRSWCNPNGRRHSCRPEKVPGVLCGRWMPRARERCARGIGHNDGHKTRYAMDNALFMASGRRSRAA